MARRKQKLTQRQTDVLTLIERGNTIHQIAETLEISNSAVYGFVRVLKEKGHLHPDQRIASNSAAVEQPTVHVGGNGGTAANNGASYGYEVAFDTLLKSSTAEAEATERLATEISETEDMLAEMKDRLTLMESRRDALRNAGKALDPELADKTQFAMADA